MALAVCRQFSSAIRSKITISSFLQIIHFKFSHFHDHLIVGLELHDFSSNTDRSRHCLGWMNRSSDNNYSRKVLICLSMWMRQCFCECERMNIVCIEMPTLLNEEYVRVLSYPLALVCVITTIADLRKIPNTNGHIHVHVNTSVKYQMHYIQTPEQYTNLWCTQACMATMKSTFVYISNTHSHSHVYWILSLNSATELTCVLSKLRNTYVYNKQHFEHTLTSTTAASRKHT